MSSNPVVNFHNATGPLREPVPDQPRRNELIAALAKVIMGTELHYTEAEMIQLWNTLRKKHNKQVKEINKKYPIDPEAQQQIKAQTSASKDQLRKEAKDLKEGYKAQETALKAQLEQQLNGLAEDHTARVQQITNANDPTRAARAEALQQAVTEFDEECEAAGVTNPDRSEKERQLERKRQLEAVMVSFMLRFPSFGKDPKDADTITYNYNPQIKKVLLNSFSQSKARVDKMLAAGRIVFIKYSVPAWLQRWLVPFVRNFKLWKENKTKESAQVRQLKKEIERRDEEIAVLQEQLRTVCDVDLEQRALLSKTDWVNAVDAMPVSGRTRGQMRKGTDVFHEEGTQESLTKAISDLHTLISDAQGKDTTPLQSKLERLEARLKQLKKRESTQQ